MNEPQPDDVTVTSYALAPLRAVGDADPRWSQPAVPTTWTAAQAVAHIPDALLFYAGQVARRADHYLPVLRDGRAAPPSEQLDNAVTAAQWPSPLAVTGRAMVHGVPPRRRTIPPRWR